MKRTIITAGLIAMTLSWCPIMSHADKPKGNPGEGISILTKQGDRYMLLRKHFDADFAAAKASKKATDEQWSKLVLIAAGIPDRQDRCREAINILVKRNPKQTLILELTDKIADNGNKAQAKYMIDTYVMQIYATLAADVEERHDETIVAELTGLSDCVSKHGGTTLSKLNDLLSHAVELCENDSAQVESGETDETVTDADGVEPEAVTTAPDIDAPAVNQSSE